MQILTQKIILFLIKIKLFQPFPPKKNPSIFYTDNVTEKNMCYRYTWIICVKSVDDEHMSQESKLQLSNNGMIVMIYKIK
jgi:hypothetical protein